MNSGRFWALCAAAALLAVVLLWRWIAGWGLVTVNFVEAPVSKVLAVMQRQTGIKILTNAPPETKVTLRVQRAPAFEALDLLAARMDGDLRLVFSLAPSRAAARAGLEALNASFRPEGWRVISAGWGGRGGGGFGVGDSAVDLRRVSLTPSAQDDLSLEAFLNQAAAKSGAAFVIPQDWNPALSKLPRRGTVGQVAAAAARSARGHLAQAVIITARPDRAEFAERGGQPGPPGQERGGPQGGGGQGGESWRQRSGPPNPEWLAERVEAQIALLPKDEQAQARQDFQQMRAFWEEVRALPEDQRRAKFEEFMSRPEVQERFEERMAARDMKRSPEQRAQRYKRYVERKRQALANP
ncbi:MAG: hypothetical protein N2322_01360 [Terrimicrobiaceae bacterium]|nr:hypothetical protein [Terrimicrobiaceae bacterium]